MADEVSGEVTLFGEPFEGATIKLFENVEDQTDPKVAAVKQTDANGEYVFTRHPNARDGEIQTWHVAVRAQDARNLFSFSRPNIEADLESSILRLADGESFSLADDEDDDYEGAEQEQGSEITVEQGGELSLTTDIEL